MLGFSPVLFGAAAGYGLGWATWVVTGHFVSGYRSHQAPSQDVPRLEAADAGSISLRAALVPVAMALWGGYVAWQASSVAVATSTLVITALLVCLSWVDFQVRRLPNPLVLALLGWAVVQSLWLGSPTLVMAAVGMAVAGGIFLLLAILGRGALGLGDVKLAAAIGALGGFPVALVGLVIGIVAGGVAALLLLLTHRAGRKDTMAYGPYLALGAWLVLTRVMGLWP